MSHGDFRDRIARINDVLCALNPRAWDGRTMMPPGGVAARKVAQATREIGIPSCVPAEVVAETAALSSRAHSAWAAARAANDFAAFAPVLERMMALQRRIAAAIGGDHPYDAMVGRFAPAMTQARLQRP